MKLEFPENSILTLQGKLNDKSTADKKNNRLRNKKQTAAVYKLSISLFSKQKLKMNGKIYCLKSKFQ